MDAAIAADDRQTTAAAKSWRRLLPQGGSLPLEHWHSRHKAILALLWVHVVAIFAFALIREFSLIHSILESGVIALLAAIASSSQVRRRTRVFTASLGLLSTSAILVHLSGGYIEMHFHFFVMVAVVALYQDWIPFIAAVGYVFLHHGIVGVLDPESVYNHAAAIADPWTWAGIHGLFIFGISMVCLVTWRMNEQILEERSTAERRLEQEREIVETLNDVGRMLAAELDLQSLLQKVTDVGTSLTSAAFGAFFYNVVDEEGESYLLYSLSGVDDTKFKDFPMPRKTAIFQPTFDGEGPVRLDDVTKDPRYGKNSPHHGIPEGHLPVRSYLAVPVVSRGTVHGGLFFGHPEVGVFAEHEERLVVGIASHAAGAIDNAQLYESEIKARRSLEEAKDQLELLAEASRVLFSSLDLPAILQGITRVAVKGIADAGVALLLGERNTVPLACALLEDGTSTITENAAVLQGTSLTPALVRALEGEAVTVSPTDPDWDQLTQLAPGEREIPDGAWRSLALIPVVRFNRTLALLILARTSETAFEPRDLELGVEMARRASIAIENAQLYATQRGVAETLQHSLLIESLPRIPGITATARYLPGGPSVEVGGDWYDLFEVPHGKVAIAMGDVAGRGVPAASLMGQLRNALRAYGLEDGGPSDVIQRLNRTMIRLELGHLATLFYGVLDLETLELTYASAGHPPSVLVGPSGLRLLEVDRGVPLGVLSKGMFSEHRVTLEPGDTLVTYTDGLIEDNKTPFEEGLDSLKHVLAEAQQTTVEALTDDILSRVLAGRERSDDVAILMVGVDQVRESLSLDVPVRSNALKALRAYLRRWLTQLGVEGEEADEIILAAGEAFSNAIVHSPVATEEFHVFAELNGNLQITVTDKGRWTNPAPSSNGRGLNIIRECMDELEIIRSHDLTTVRMTRDVTRKS